MTYKHTPVNLSIRFGICPRNARDRKTQIFLELYMFGFGVMDVHILHSQSRA